MKAFIARGLIVLAGAILLVVATFIVLQYLIANPPTDTRSQPESLTTS